MVDSTSKETAFEFVKAKRQLIVRQGIALCLVALLTACGGEARPVLPEAISVTPTITAVPPPAIQDAAAPSAVLSGDDAPETNNGSRPAVVATKEFSAPASSEVVVAPSVSRLETFEGHKTTHVYAQGLFSPSWGSSVNEPMNLLMDVYEPVDAPAGRPLMVFIHGGGFFGGTRKGGAGENFGEYFAARGFVVASIDYRLAKHHGTIPVAWTELIMSKYQKGRRADQLLAMYPAARDAKAALRWLVAEQDRFGINPEYVTVAGGSAGAYLAVMVGVSDKGDFLDELDASSDPTLGSTNPDEIVEVDTVLDFWGGPAHLEMLTLIDGKTRFDPDDPSLMIVHGTEDPIVPYESAETLAKYYETAGARYELHPIVGGGHGGWNKIIDGKTLVELSFDFVLETQNLVLSPAKNG